MGRIVQMIVVIPNIMARMINMEIVMATRLIAKPVRSKVSILLL